MILHCEKKINNNMYVFGYCLMQNAGAAFVGCVILYIISMIIYINFVNNK